MRIAIEKQVILLQTHDVLKILYLVEQSTMNLRSYLVNERTFYYASQKGLKGRRRTK